jgi:hypothetical protein
MITRTHANGLWMTQNLPGKLDKKPVSRKKGRPATLLSEAQVLECRARHEFADWSVAHCASYYETTASYMRQLLSYSLRSNLHAEPKHANIGVTS